MRPAFPARASTPDPTLDVWTPAFVGRAHELGVLEAARLAVQGGESRIVLVAGEPGIGKTRLVTEALALVQQGGVRVLRSRCWEGGGAPAFWPWVQLLRGIVDAPGAARVLANVGVAAGDLVLLLPEIEGHVKAPPTPPALDAEQARFRMFETVLSLLKAAGAQRPMALWVDDLHAADAPSLELLRFVAAHLSFPGLLLVACYRDTEVVVAEKFQRALTAMLRAPQCKRLHLSGLDATDVGTVVGEALGIEPPAGLVEELRARTDGNALLVTELTRALVDRRHADADDWREVVARVPPTLRDVIGSRLAELSAESRKVLEAASVAGRDFEVSSVAAVTRLETGAVFAALDRAARLGMVMPVQEAADRFRFAHALILDCVYAGVAPASRMTFHRGLAVTLAARYGDRDGQHLAAIAHHFGAAGGLEDRREAFAYLLRAGKHARRLLAFEEAAEHFTRALEIAPDDDSVRFEVLSALADAQRNASQPQTARETAQLLLEIARKVGDPELCARAALAYAGPPILGQPDPEVISVLEWALARMAGIESPSHVRLLARMVSALSLAPSQERRAALARTALDMAARIDDFEGHTAAVFAAHDVLWLPDRSLNVVQWMDLISGYAADRGHGEVEALAQLLRFTLVLREGDMEAAASNADRCAALADELRQPRHSWQVTAMQATLAVVEGRFADAQRRASEALAIGCGGNIALAEFYYVAHMMGILRDVGGLRGIVQRVRTLARLYPEMCVWEMALLFVEAETDRLDRVQRMLQRLSVDEISNNFYWLLSCGLLAEAVARVGHAGLAPDLYDAIHQYDGQVLSIGVAAYLGPVARYLALLAAVSGRHEVAQEHFASALDTAQRMKAVPMVARIKYEWAASLVQAGYSLTAPEVVVLVDGARELARRLRMRPLLRRLERFGLTLDTPTQASMPATRRVKGFGAASNGSVPRESVERYFSRDGDGWVLGGADRSFRLRDTRGLRYLAWLVQYPGREVHVLELVGADSGTPAAGGVGARGAAVAAGLTIGGGGMGPIVDLDARRAYRERLRDLRDRLAEAEANCDLGRMSAAREEIRHLSRQLATGGGIEGEGAGAGSATERARISVRNNIANALARIARHDTDLWRHLANSVKTGTFCSYEPERPVRWRF
ncbi:AAA family ATPase [Candidatus Binatia bacterium]|nr:AAA family ATPase [Candidatus Binatia bacterium]